VTEDVQEILFLGACQPSRSTNYRTGRLEAPSMPVSSSAVPGSPPQPSWRIRAMISRIRRSRYGVWILLSSALSRTQQWDDLAAAE
jgi:hypothetical protein